MGEAMSTPAVMTGHTPRTSQADHNPPVPLEGLPLTVANLRHHAENQAHLKRARAKEHTVNTEIPPTDDIFEVFRQSSQGRSIQTWLSDTPDPFPTITQTASTTPTEERRYHLLDHNADAQPDAQAATAKYRKKRSADVETYYTHKTQTWLDLRLLQQWYDIVRRAPFICRSVKRDIGQGLEAMQRQRVAEGIPEEEVLRKELKEREGLWEVGYGERVKSKFVLKYGLYDE